MFKKFLVIGLVSLTSFAGLCAPCEAGHRHRAKKASRHSCAPVTDPCCNSMHGGYTNYSNSGYATPMQYTGYNNFGSNYGNSGLSGNLGSYGGQGLYNGNVRSSLLGNGMILGR